MRKIAQHRLTSLQGGMGDDDDVEDGGNENTWKKFFLKSPEEASSVVAASKENGATAHLTAMCIANEFYLLGGSKNVHMLARTGSTISSVSSVLPQFFSRRRLKSSSVLPGSIQDSQDSYACCLSPVEPAECMLSPLCSLFAF